MVYINIICLALVVIYIVDISGIVDSLKWTLGRWLNITVGRLKPIDCSLCMTWWVGLIYIIAAGEFSIYTLLCVAMVSALSAQIGQGITLLREALSAGINAIENRLWKQ